MLKSKAYEPMYLKLFFLWVFHFESKNIEYSLIVLNQTLTYFKSLQYIGQIYRKYLLLTLIEGCSLSSEEITYDICKTVIYIRVIN